MLRRRNNQIVDTTDPYIKPLGHLDSFSFLIRRRAVYIKGYGSTQTQITAANVWGSSFESTESNYGGPDTG